MGQLKRKELLFLILLGIPSLGLAMTYTLVTTYVPFFIEKISNASVTGILISVEGVFALSVPVLVGEWSDSISSGMGKRLPFFFAGVLITSFSLILMPFSRDSLVLLTTELIFFFIGYFTFYEAYFALYPDLIPDEERGRSQGIMGAFRSIGMLIALTGGGLLINVWTPLPFLLYTAIMIAVAVLLYYTVRDRIKKLGTQESAQINWTSSLTLIKSSRNIQLWLVANILWEAAVSVLRVFIVLYFTKGLQMSMVESSGALGLVGLSAIIAAPFAGFLADKIGHRPVVLISTLFFAIGLIPPLFTINRIFLFGILPVAFAAVILMTLPFSMLMHYLPKDQQHGAGAALFGFCQGLGVLIGPITAGFVIQATEHFDFLVFEKTQGYSAMFFVASLFLFLSLPFAIKLFKRVQQEKPK